MFFTSFSSAAYIDISAVSFLAPAIAAIVVAVSSTVYLLWKKAKSKVAKTLGIDENAGKEVEDDVVIVDESAAEETEKTSDAESAKEE